MFLSGSMSRPEPKSSILVTCLARSGIGSSSSFTVGLLNALNAQQGRYISKEQLAAEAIYVEQDLIQEPVGSQDQIAAALWRPEPYRIFDRWLFHGFANHPKPVCAIVWNPDC